ncbi:PadR family transcriptional regulator [Paenibacillus sp. NPDC058174]|uniref:PadR family transcriptional regulator n=1 Tax=Paenibacillus sp. NPDC058174 TaxID=3346366 RepID=UPI0036DA0577
MVETVSLGILMQGKMSGYDIKKIAEQSVSLFIKMSYGSLYPALKRLVSAGHLIEEETNDSKNKKLYAITEQGRSYFMNWLREPLQANKREHLLKLFFYDYLDESTRLQNLQAFQHTLRSGIAQMEAVQGIVSKELEQIPNKDDYYYRVSVMHYGLQFFRMEHDFFSKMIEKGEW